jgi:shikimate dehydrogenase
MTRHLAAVIGWPARQSVSPTIFTHFSRRMNRPLDYRAMPIEPGDLRSAVKSAKAEPWVGWNVTIPHKVNILPLMDSLDASAKDIGAVNVVRFLDKGPIGYNTDSEGFLAPLERMGFSMQGRRAVVFGAGGAARAVCAGLRRNGIKEIMVMNRTASRTEPLVKEFGVQSAVSDFRNIREAVAQADIVVNATPLGMDGKTSPLGNDGSSAPAGGKDISWKKAALAYDLVYRPLETPFLRQAREGGTRTLGGLAMLVAQAAATWRIWFGEEVPLDVSASIEDHLRRTLI